MKELKQEFNLIVQLTLAKVEILKLKADNYTWSCFVDTATKEQLEETLVDIDKQLKLLKS